MSELTRGFRERYSAALAAYVAGPSEANLEQAYELGREAVAGELSMLDIAAVHHDVLTASVRDADDAAERERRADAARAFFVEGLSSFEMTQRGFLEARETARAEQQHSEQLRGLADAAVEINATRSLDDILRIVLDRARELVGAQRAAVSIDLDDRGGTVIDARSTASSLDERAPPRVVPRGHELAVQATGSPRPVRVTREELEAQAAALDNGSFAPPAVVRGWLAAPLTGRQGRRIGLIELSDKEHGDFTPNDEAVVTQLAQMASVALENARLYQREHWVAHTLQQSLLPETLPVVPGVDVAARYVAAGEGNEVGGDFYDAFELDDSRWLIVIGDVCGKGAEAAAVTALARYTIRAAALHEPRPSDILASLNQAILAQRTDGRFCTVACASLEREGDALELSLVSAGHPLPLLVHADGQVEAVGRHGTLLGVLPDARLPEDRVRLRDGDTLVFFTDGVTDAHQAEDWQDRLIALLADSVQLDADSIARRLEAAALEVQPGPPRDDIAVLVIALGERSRRGPAEHVPAPPLSLRLPPLPESVARARRALDELAAELGPRLLADLRLALTEIVTNSVRHAGLRPHDAIRVEVKLRPETVRLEVRDAGPGFRPSLVADRPGSATAGWGLYLLDGLTDRWGVERSIGTLVWAEIDRAPH